jgi:D-amino-acid dehydrogenase
MAAQGTVAVIGAGVVGAVVASALAREGLSVLLFDRDEPGIAGASFGNAGHIAAELVEPLPSVALLLNFWKELFARGGPLDVPLNRVPALLPWFARFGAAAFRQTSGTRVLAPLVKPAAAALERGLGKIGRGELLRRQGHYEIWFGSDARHQAYAQETAIRNVGVRVESASMRELQVLCAHSKQAEGAALWFPDSGHVVDPLKIVQAFVEDARAHGAVFSKTSVRAIVARSGEVEIHATEGRHLAQHVVVCAGPWSADLLKPLGLRVPLQSVRGYHVELADVAGVVDAPVLYSRERVIVTPMAGRLRATSYMEFMPPGAAADARKPRRLREHLQRLGYSCAPDGPSWVGGRPVLPDYLPGIGRMPATNVFYAIGHQHIGLTLAAVTGDLIADLVVGRKPSHDVSPFDLRRFG